MFGLLKNFHLDALSRPHHTSATFAQTSQTSSVSKLMKTRDRILTTSLLLFNDKGEPNITTVDVAHEMDISPGNLYYHFRNKDDIIHELFQQFERSMSETMEASAASFLSLGDHQLMLQLIFDTTWEYRFFYRDLNHLISKDIQLKRRFLRLVDKQKKATWQVLKSYVAHGALAVNTATLEHLVEQIIFILTFWINYQLIHTTPNKDTIITTGMQHINEILLPYFNAVQTAP